MNEKTRVSVRVTGLVQGVGYRYFAQDKAAQRGIKGTVRNAPDGSVECVAEGDKKEVRAFLEDLKHGPSSSEVDQVEAVEHPFKGEFKKFEIIF
jgi:acylphosphatase